MIRTGALRGVAGLLGLLTFLSHGRAVAAPEPSRRVVVAGPRQDAITIRVQKELSALGFEPIAVGELAACGRAAVGQATTENRADAVICSDGEQVGVWVIDGKALRLREVVVARGDADDVRETAAVQAAEITRAALALRDASTDEPHVASPSEPAAPPAHAPQPLPTELMETHEAHAIFDRALETKRPAKPRSSRTPLFVGGAGIGTLMGIDASAVAFSSQIEVGVHRWFSATARFEYPFAGQRLDLGNTSNIRVAPAFAGAGVNVPLAAPTAFIIPRLGGGAGAAWVRATRAPEVALDGQGNVGSTSTGATDSVSSFAVYASAAISMRIVGHLRVMVDGIFGSTTARLVVRDRGVDAAYWGAPFGSLSMRMELQFE